MISNCTSSGSWEFSQTNHEMDLLFFGGIMLSGNVKDITIAWIRLWREGRKGYKPGAGEQLIYHEMSVINFQRSADRGQSLWDRAASAEPPHHEEVGTAQLTRGRSTRTMPAPRTC